MNRDASPTVRSAPRDDDLTKIWKAMIEAAQGGE